MNYKIGISTSVFSGKKVDLINAIKIAHKYNFNAIEIISSYPYYKSSKINRRIKRKITSLSNELGLILQLHAPFYSINLADHNREVREFSIKEIISTLDLGYDINAKLVTIHAGLCFLPCKVMYRKTINILLESLSILLDKAEDTGIKLALETRADNFDIGKPGELLFIIEKIKSKYLGITFDTVQAQLLGRPPEVFSTIIKYCVNIHLRDLKDGDDLLAVGKGEIDFEALLQKVISLGYSGPFIIEVSDLESAIMSKKELLKMLQKK